MSVEMLENMAMERLPLKSVKLIYGDQVLLDGSASLREAGLSNGSMVSVVHKPLGAFTAVHEHRSEPISFSKKVFTEESSKATLEVSGDGSAKLSVEEAFCDESEGVFDVWSGMGHSEITQQVFVGNVVDYDGHQFTATFKHLEETRSSYPYREKEICIKFVDKRMTAKIDGSALTVVSTDFNGKLGDTWAVTPQ
jgi:hypothetical protein